MSVVINLVINKNYELKRLSWDTNYFNIESARVNLKGIIDEKSQKHIIDFCKNYKFITISNIDNIKENNEWIGIKTNAFLADLNIQFEKDLIEKDKVEYNKNIHIRNNLSENKDILKIARESFNYSRFFNDSKLPNQKAKEIYLNWTKSSFNKKSKYFAIYEIDNCVAGYILFSIYKDFAVIELIAVSDKYQGLSIGKKLILEMELFNIKQKVKKIKVGTQVTNIRAAQFYNSMGFKYVSCSSVYHLWSN